MYEEEASSIVKDILEGLCEIHNKNFIHRDLKPENILLSRKTDERTGNEVLISKIADFGLSTEHKVSISHTTNVEGKNGTILYMAPE